MKTRINAIIGLLLMMAGLFSLAVLLTSCDPEGEISEVITEPVDNGDGTQTTSGGAISTQHYIDRNSIILHCILIGMTDEFCEEYKYDIHEYDFEGIGKEFYDEDVVKQEINQMLKKHKATGASYVYIYEGEQKFVPNPNAKVKYNIIWKPIE